MANQVLAICIGRTLTLPLCLSELLLLLQIIFSRRRVRVWGASSGRSLKRIPIWPYFFGIFNSFPIVIPNFSFVFLSHQIVEEIFFLSFFLSFFLGMFFSLSCFLGFRNPRKQERKKNIPRKKERRKKNSSTISTGLNKESSGCPNDCVAVPSRRLGNWGCSKKSTKNKSVNRSSDKQSESVDVRP